MKLTTENLAKLLRSKEELTPLVRINIAKRIEQYQHEAKVLSKKPTLDPLKRTHIEQMLSYIAHRDREGWYYGQITHFDKRQVEIVAWLQDALEKLK